MSVADLYRQFPHADPTGMAELEHVERIAVSGVPVYNFDWRDPHSPSKWRPEWQKVLDVLHRKNRQAQSDGVAALYHAAWRVLQHPRIRPDSTANICSWACDLMESHMRAGTESKDEFQAWVCTAIREAMHDVIRDERVWLDPKYQKPLDTEEYLAKAFADG